MSLIRLGIRRAFAEILTSTTAAADRVTTNRSDQIWKAGLPALTIYTVEDPARHESEPRTYRRACEIDIELFVRRSDGELVDDDLDRLAHQVFELIEINFRALCRTFDLDYGQSGFAGEQLDYSGAGSKPLGGSRMRWRMVYFQERPTNLAGLSQLEGTDVEWEVPSSATAEREAIDAIDPPPV